MSESGVIPPPEERQPGRAVVVGHIEDVDGVPVVFSVNHDGTVRLAVSVWGSDEDDYTTADLDKKAREQFMRLWCEAERQAEATMPP